MTKTKIVGNYMPAKYPDPYSDMEGDWTVWDCRLASQRSPKPIITPIAHCPSEEESLCKPTDRADMEHLNHLQHLLSLLTEENEEHLAGYEVSVNLSKQYPLCEFCHHHHLPGFGNCRD